ncbi:hypothetical protein Nepgr_023184 [Nepenthes gracilis]|uniref:Uncharacterized protein n=1 Tax=Nepenthes gracilis TaxID=150966 RepID=A0AAD3XXH2_NEPGR|nr:hypothetical protein Nepgr_023184 [Nepenthes gracilis]
MPGVAYGVRWSAAVSAEAVLSSDLVLLADDLLLIIAPSAGWSLVIGGQQCWGCFCRSQCGDRLAGIAWNTSVVVVGGSHFVGVPTMDVLQLPIASCCGKTRLGVKSMVCCIMDAAVCLLLLFSGLAKIAADSVYAALVPDDLEWYCY